MICNVYIYVIINLIQHYNNTIDNLIMYVLIFKIDLILFSN